MKVLASNSNWFQTSQKFILRIMTQFTPPAKFYSDKDHEWFDMFSPRYASHAKDGADVYFEWRETEKSWRILTHLETLNFKTQLHERDQARIKDMGRAFGEGKRTPSKHDAFYYDTDTNNA